ncbi:hypothetical protein EDB89DRAFT_1912536 [Lactarius sanguifluus]|nr:hypothetical protein EDB89DRAFT_1912536 [Lactarius sanguifluus]
MRAVSRGCGASQAVAQASAGREASYMGPWRSWTRRCRRARAARKCDDVGRGKGCRLVAKEWGVLDKQGRPKTRREEQGEESGMRGEPRGELSAQRARESGEALNVALRKRTQCGRVRASVDSVKVARNCKMREFTGQGERWHLDKCVFSLGQGIKRDKWVFLLLRFDRAAPRSLNANPSEQRAPNSAPRGNGIAISDYKPREWTRLHYSTFTAGRSG